MLRELRSLYTAVISLIEKIRRLKVGSDVADLMTFGSLFQAETAATTKRGHQ